MFRRLDREAYRWCLMCLAVVLALSWLGHFGYRMLDVLMFRAAPTWYLAQVAIKFGGTLAVLEYWPLSIATAVGCAWLLFVWRGAADAARGAGFSTLRTVRPFVFFATVAGLAILPAHELSGHFTPRSVNLSTGNWDQDLVQLLVLKKRVQGPGATYELFGFEARGSRIGRVVLVIQIPNLVDVNADPKPPPYVWAVVAADEARFEFDLDEPVGLRVVFRRGVLKTGRNTISFTTQEFPLNPPVWESHRNIIYQPVASLRDACGPWWLGALMPEPEEGTGDPFAEGELDPERCWRYALQEARAYACEDANWELNRRFAKSISGGCIGLAAVGILAVRVGRRMPLLDVVKRGVLPCVAVIVAFEIAFESIQFRFPGVFAVWLPGPVAAVVGVITLWRASRRP